MPSTRIAGAYGRNDANGASLATSTSLTVAVGDLVIVTAKSEAAFATVTGVTDTLGNTYTPVAASLSFAANAAGSRQFYAVITTAGTSAITAAYSPSADFRRISAEQFRPPTGFALSFDASNQATGTSAAPSAGSASATAAGVAVTSGGLFASGTMTPGSGWTAGGDANDGNGLFTQYRIVSGAGSITGDTTWSVSDSWSAHLVIFKEVASLPAITAQPVQQTVASGATATFSVTATASAGALSYQWRKYSGGTMTNIGGATSSSYTTPTLSSADNGSLFDVQVTDSNGTVGSAQVWLFLSGQPLTGKGTTDGLNAWMRH